MNPPRAPFDDNALIYFQRKLAKPSIITFIRSFWKYDDLLSLLTPGSKDLIARPVQTPEIAKEFLFSEGTPDADVMRYYGNMGPSSYTGPVSWRQEKLDENYIKAVQAQKIHGMSRIFKLGANSSSDGRRR